MKSVMLSRTARIFAVCAAITVFTGCASAPHGRNAHLQFVKNVPLIAGNIGESEALLFLIDTGVDPSVIDLNVARRVGLSVDESEIGEAAGTGDGAGLAVMRASIEGLVIAGSQHPPIEALAADLSSFSRALKTDLAGILGYSFLKRRVVRIDYPAKEIAFGETVDKLPPKRTETKTSYLAPLKFNGDDDPIPVFDILIADERITVSLDTGKSAGIEFYDSAGDRVRTLGRVAAGKEATRIGARGAKTVTAGVLQSLRLGPFTIKDVPVSFSDHKPAGEAREGNAGNRFLRNFVVTIDYAQGDIIFER